jgi:hypothetical protein
MRGLPRGTPVPVPERRHANARGASGAADKSRRSVVSAEISLDQIESGYQKLADPEVSRVVITRFGIPEGMRSLISQQAATRHGLAQ